MFLFLFISTFLFLFLSLLFYLVFFYLYFFFISPSFSFLSLFISPFFFVSVSFYLPFFFSFYFSPSSFFVSSFLFLPFFFCLFLFISSLLLLVSLSFYFSPYLFCLFLFLSPLLFLSLPFYFSPSSFLSISLFISPSSFFCLFLFISPLLFYLFLFFFPFMLYFFPILYFTSVFSSSENIFNSQFLIHRWCLFNALVYFISFMFFSSFFFSVFFFTFYLSTPITLLLLPPSFLLFFSSSHFDFSLQYSSSWLRVHAFSRSSFFLLFFLFRLWYIMALNWIWRVTRHIWTSGMCVVRPLVPLLQDPFWLKVTVTFGVPSMVDIIFKMILNYVYIHMKNGLSLREAQSLTITKNQANYRIKKSQHTHHSKFLALKTLILQPSIKCLKWMWTFIPFILQPVLYGQHLID